MSVPVDYQHPSGAKTRIAVAELPARDPAALIGDLIVDFGGPDASGVEHLRDPQAPFAATLRDRFNLISFDPRGVGGSGPDVACLTPPQLTTYFSAARPPTNPAEASDLVRLNQHFDRGCAAQLGTTLRFAGLSTTADDLEQLRRALGDSSLNYLGLSSGGYLGTLYAERHPDRIRSMILDSPLDHSLNWSDFLLDESVALDTNFRAFAAWCDATTACALHTANPATDAATQYDQLVNRAAVSPIPVASGGDHRPVSDTDVRVATIALLQLGQTNWPFFSTAIQSARAGNATLLRIVGDAVDHRDPTGAYSASSGAFLAILCNSWTAPATTAAGYERLAARAAQAAPRFGPTRIWDWGPYCSGWPAPVSDPVHLPRIRSGTHILVIGTTLDPVAPYQWAATLAQRIPGSVLLTNEGTSHTAFVVGRCQSAEDAYLTTGAMPPAGTRCPLVPAGV